MPLFPRSPARYKMTMAHRWYQGGHLLGTFRRHDRRGFLPWLMALVLLGQALFPIQLHTRLVLGPDGRLVQVCTLQGIKSVLVQATDEERVADQNENGRSPACAFSQLPAGALPAGFAVWRDRLQSTAVAAVPSPKSMPRAPLPRHTPIRAPPTLF